MKDFIVNRKTLPDWSPCHSHVMVYPYKMSGRNQLLPLYHYLLTIIPNDIEIRLLVKNSEEAGKVLKKAIPENFNIDRIKFMEFPDLFDIWIRDYAPLTTVDMDMLIPVKFEYSPSYLDNKYRKYIQRDNEIGEILGKELISEGIRSIYFNWDMGNLTHNGQGTVIITNRLIADNQNISIDHELKSMLYILCGFSNIVFIPVEPHDETGHVDGMVRFIDEHVLVVGSYLPGSHNFKFMENLAESLRKDLGDGFKIIRLQNGQPEDIKSDGVSSAYGNHMNFMRINDTIFFPYYSAEVSEKPMQEFISVLAKNNLPIEVIPIDLSEITDLARLGGVLNCITWQTYKTRLP